MTRITRTWAHSALFTNFILPVLIGISLVIFGISAGNSQSYSYGTNLSIRTINADSNIDPSEALLDLTNSPAHLSKKIEQATPIWLLASLQQRDKKSFHDIFFPFINSETANCWLIGSYGPTGERIINHKDFGSAITTKQVIRGSYLAIPNTSTANQLLCKLDIKAPATIAVQQWHHQDFHNFLSNNSRNNAILEGGLLTLAFFLAIIAITLREPPYILIAAWLLCNIRLGAWVFGWDHQWFSYTINPDTLFWLRKLTVILYFWLTWLIFTRIYRHQLSIKRIFILEKIGKFTTLALAILTFADISSQMAIFIAAWIAAAFISTILIYALFHYSSRLQFTHTIAVCIATICLFTGLVLVGLGQVDLLNPTIGTYTILIASLAITLAAANCAREDRLNNIKNRNELISSDSLTPIGMFTLSSNRQFERLNANARKILGLDDQKNLHGLYWHDVFPDINWEEVSNTTEQGRDTEISAVSDEPNNARSFLLRAVIVGNRIEGSLQDISARSETIRKLRLLADNDPLTDTLNRHGIEKAIQDEITSVQEGTSKCALGFLDIDHLRRINNLFGHSTGDSLLQMVCERMRYSLSEQHKLGRIGSDEFIILFPGMTAQEANKVGQDIIESLNESSLYVGERAFQLKTSLGIIDLDSHMTPKDAITAANRACRQAHKQHKDIVLYESNNKELFAHRGELHILEQLEEGKRPEDIYISMQPIMSLKNPLKYMNFEILLRIKGYESDPSQTGKIIQAAEDNGMISNVDKWVFSTTLDWLAKHRLKLDKTSMVNINISGVSLNNDKFINKFFAILNERPQYSRKLCVEITEGVALQDLERTRQFMRRLQRMGAKVALDDFGAGYTSFSYLKELPADLIKIDGSLIHDMLKSKTNIAIINSIVDLAHNLGMECIAEWVEDIDTLKMLKDMGVDHIQGYVISPAVSPSYMLEHENIIPLINNVDTIKYIRQISGSI